MRTVLLSIPILSLLALSPAEAAFYQWTDAAGVVHLTDDPKKVPQQYRGRAERIEVPDPPSAPAATPTREEPRAATPSEAPGGQGEKWWRDRMAVLRTELKTLQEARKLKEQQLVELRRKRTIFQRARDREAVNAMQAGVAADESRIAEVLNKIEALELAAARAGVPAEWLR